MPTQDTSGIKGNILSILKQRGPSLPVHIARETSLSILFASAFLSELLSERKIKISNMRVGSSPIYYILGQENQLENFSLHLNNKEKEAFTILRNKKILKDIEQEPAIRVALRSIKDFAIPFKEGEEIFWRYFITEQPEPKAKEIAKIETPKKQEPKKEISKEINSPIIKKVDIFDKPKKKSAQKEKSEFVVEIINSLKESDIELIQEREFKKREFMGVGKIKTNIGSMEILIMAKDKKTITENDLTVSIQKSQTEKKIILFISPGKLDKKATELLQEYKNILKFVRYNRKP